MGNKKFVTDKSMTHCRSQFRTYEVFGIQDKLHNPPTYLNWNYEDVKLNCESLNRTFGGNHTVVKCMLTITDREINEESYHWTDHITGEARKRL